VAADLILLIHTLIVAFIILGLVLIFTGKVLSWAWVRNPWFRITHLLSISIVVIQSWFVYHPIQDDSFVYARRCL
jgi:hypothetical protein